MEILSLYINKLYKIIISIFCYIILYISYIRGRCDVISLPPVPRNLIMEMSSWRNVRHLRILYLPGKLLFCFICFQEKDSISVNIARHLHILSRQIKMFVWRTRSYLIFDDFGASPHYLGL